MGILFICCDEPANSSNVITANYIYASEPIIANIARGNLGNNSTTEEQNLLRELVERELLTSLKFQTLQRLLVATFYQTTPSLLS